jgi:hypothetical protein
MKSSSEHNYKSNLQLHDKDLTYKIFLQVCSPDDMQDALNILPKMLRVAGDVYDLTQKYYTENSLHDLS